MSKKKLSKADILGANDIRTEAVDVPEWGGSVNVRGMSALDRDAWEMEVVTARKEGRPANVRAGIVARCIVDDDGNRMFSDADAIALAAKSSTVMDRLYQAAERLSAVSPDTIAELEGN